MQPAPHYHRGLPRPGPALVGRVEPHRQRLDERPLQGAHVLGQLEAQVRLVGHILLKHPVHRGSGEEHHVRAKVVPAGAAELAVPAGSAGLQGHPVAGLQMRDALARLHHHAAGLVAQHKGRLHHVIPNRPGFIVVQIAAADPHILQLYQHLALFRLGNLPLGVANPPDALHHGHLHLSFHNRLPLFPKL